jgi:hypothetical protein
VIGSCHFLIGSMYVPFLPYYEERDIPRSCQRGYTLKGNDKHCLSDNPSDSYNDIFFELFEENKMYFEKKRNNRTNLLFNTF